MLVALKTCICSACERLPILFVVEEETKTSEFSIYRLARYCLDLAELMGTDRVIPVVIFLRTGNQRSYLRLGSDSCAYMEFRYLMCRLKSLPSAKYYDSDNIVARLNLPNMSCLPEDRLEMYLAAQTGLAQLETNPEKQRKYADFIDFYADLSEEEIIRYRESYLSEKGEIMGLVSVFKEEGRREGRKAGRKEGSYNTLYSVIQTMRKNGIADENIAKMMNLNIYTVKKVLNREEIEIPLNLL